MKLVNEFDVAASLDTTWSTLLDVPRVARALPGATIEDDAADGAWRGGMKIKLGPVTTEYAGTARLQDVDEDDRVAGYRVEGREARGQGTAAATITTRLSERDGQTHVVVETDMQVTGRQAQLGRNLMEDVAGGVLTEFASRLEAMLQGGLDTPAEQGGSDVLDVSSAVRGPLLERAGIALVGVLVGLVLGRLVRRR
jgi:carbon monoxide dehydrogenase subunit G